MDEPKFKFIDLFCGIGGMRLAFQKALGQCVFSCDWDKFARETYKENFGEEPFRDIKELDPAHIPPYDILAAGFPCQPFSNAGVSKKNSLGRPHGFEDKTQGTLFFELARIIKFTQPSAFVLENVANLANHDKGRTLGTILEALEVELDYDVHVGFVNAKAFVPQHRDRIFIVGFREPRAFKFPDLPTTRPPKFKSILQRNPHPKYNLTRHLWTYLKKYRAKHEALGHGFGYTLVDLNGHSRTLSARYHKDGSEILIPRGGRKNPRRLTPRECANLMGFPKKFKIKVSDTQAYRQFGNSVVVPVVSTIAVAVAAALDQPVVARKPSQLDLLAVS